MAKEYTIKVKTYRHHASSEYSERLYTGTMEYLINNVFGYKLECGHSWNRKIPTNLKQVNHLLKH